MEGVKFRSKKGLSPVIATVLLVMVVMFLAAIVFFWARGFITEQIQKFGKPIEDECGLVDFSVAVVPGTYGQHALEVFNHGNTEIFRLEIKKTLGGDSEMGRFEFRIGVGKPVREDVSLMMADGSKPDTVTIYPALLGDIRGNDLNKAFTCIKLGEKITI